MQILQEKISAVHGGSTLASDHHGRWKCRFFRSKKPAMRVMVVANCARSTSLAVNKAAVNVARSLYKFNM